MWLREHNPAAPYPRIHGYPLKYNVIHSRNYSEVTNDQPKESFIPVVIYYNAFENRPIILKDTKNKAGIYRWVNKVNGNTYIGSSVDLSRRLRVYYDFSYLIFHFD